MRHNLIIQGHKISLYIGGCNKCKDTEAILLGKRSRMCLNCLKNNNYKIPTCHIPFYLIEYTNKTLVFDIKSGRIEQYKVERKRLSHNIWQIISPKQTSKHNPNKWN